MNYYFILKGDVKMKTEDDYKIFLKELKKLCEKYKIGIVGTDSKFKNKGG